MPFHSHESKAVKKTLSESRKIQDGCALKRWWKRCFRGGLATPGWHWMRGKAAVPFPTPPSPLNVLCKMHITQRCALVYINIQKMKNAFSTKIGRVGEPKQGAGEEEHYSWRWSLIYNKGFTLTAKSFKHSSFSVTEPQEKSWNSKKLWSCLAFCGWLCKAQETS